MFYVKRTLSALVFCVFNLVLSQLVEPISILFFQDTPESANLIYSIKLILLLVSLSVLVTLFLSFVFFDTSRKYIEAAAFDYKYVAGMDSKSLKDFLFKLFPTLKSEEDIKEFFYNKNISSVSNSDKLIYVSANEFFSKEYNQDFATVCIKNSDKQNTPYITPWRKILIKLGLTSAPTPQYSIKCIVQCSFIPIDNQRNTILIHRKPNGHQSLKGFLKKSAFSFISFSPIPNRFCEEFNALSTYFREVPESKFDTYKPSHVTDIGIVFRYDQFKKTFYMFYIFVASYNCVFDTNTIKEIFALDPKAKIPTYFKKDHDDIVGIINLKELHNYCFSNLPDKKISKETAQILEKGTLLPVEKAALSLIIEFLKNNQLTHERERQSK